jgi:hypothetical protein
MVRGKSHIWTPEQDEYLIKYYALMSVPVLAKQLGVKESQVRYRILQLGVKNES